MEQSERYGQVIYLDPQALAEQAAQIRAIWDEAERIDAERRRRLTDKAVRALTLEDIHDRCRNIERGRD